MKIIRTTLLVLLLGMIGMEAANARISSSSHASHSSTSSFRSSFSSSKSSLGSTNSRISSTSSNTLNTKFGSFSKSGTGAASSGSYGSMSGSTSAPTSAFSRDLSSTAANKAALRTFDARTAAAAPTVAPPTSRAFAPSSPYYGGAPAFATSRTYVNPPVYVPAAPATVVVQQSSSFLSNPVLWFMLGHSLGNHDHDRVVVDRQVYVNGSPAPGATVVQGSTSTVPATGSDAWTDNGAQASLQDPAFVADAIPTIAQQSTASKLLHGLLWISGLAAVGGGVAYMLARRSARLATKTTNYTL